MYNPFSIAGKTILVTGAASGIGRAISIECTKMEANVILTDKNEEGLLNVYNEVIGSKNQYITADLTNNYEITALVKRIPIINGIVHSAGIGITLPFQFYNNEKVKKIIDINLLSPIELTNHILKYKKNEKSDFSIVFISSVDGYVISYPGASIYSASKAGLIGLAKGLAIDLAHKKIRVNSVLPGIIQTPFLDGKIDKILPEIIEQDKKNYPLGGYGKPEEVAYAVIYFLSDASSWVTGANLIVDGGFTLQ